MSISSEPETTCPVCLNAFGATASCTGFQHQDVNCAACGTFFMEYRARTEPGDEVLFWNQIRRAALAHKIRTRRDVPLDPYTSRPCITKDVMDRFREVGIDLPTPSQQANNFLRLIGDQERELGTGYADATVHLYTRIGSSDPEAAVRLVEELGAEGLVNQTITPKQDHIAVIVAQLTLKGWRAWEELKRGDRSSGDGFIAMQFDDKRLDKLFQEVIRKEVREQLKRDVHRVDSTDKTRAGVIDNIMREAIEDAAFVLVELTHDNRGAYWEAGFAEGLRKPVIYLCEESAWKDPDTEHHFDVNHCTFELWNEDEPDEFVKRLIATISNSLRKTYG